jgi:hypothetical protein
LLEEYKSIRRCCHKLLAPQYPCPLKIDATNAQQSGLSWRRFQPSTWGKTGDEHGGNRDRHGCQYATLKLSFCYTNILVTILRSLTLPPLFIHYGYRKRYCGQARSSAKERERERERGALVRLARYMGIAGSRIQKSCGLCNQSTRLEVKFAFLTMLS